MLPRRDAIAFAVLYAQLVVVVWLVPRWSPSLLAEPTQVASVAAVVTTLGLTFLHLRHRPRAERLLLAYFLAGMPVIYLWSWLRTPQPGWLPVELVGVGVFGALAVLGAARAPWLLAAGIAAHGLVWDLPHHGRTTFIPDWYTTGCLIADLGIAAYAALTLPRPERGPSHAH